MPLMPVPNDLNERRAEQKRALAAIEAMHRARPLKPPPLPRTVYAPSAGRLALEREIRAGHYVPRERIF
jgi:hypothetical protein